MTHLGDRVTDLVDGQLGPEATDRAHAHLARCMDCREAVEAERLMKSRLASLPAPPPGGDLVGRLLAIGTPSSTEQPAGLTTDRPADRAPVPAVRPAGPPATPSRPAASRPAGARPGGRPTTLRRHGRRSGRRRIAVAFAGALSVMGVGAAGLTLAPASLQPGTFVPPVATFFVEHTATTRDLPFVDMPVGWFGDDESQGGH